MVRLSVIIPGYNTPEAWWKRCVESVLKAIGPEDEVICVDDGSGESLKLRIENLELKDDRIKVIYKKNGGLGDARNAGMAVAQGKYVTFVDSDDEVTPEVYEHCIGQMEETKSDIAIFGFRTIWVEEGVQKIDRLFDCSDFSIRNGEELTPREVLGLVNARLFNYAWNKVYRREFLEKNGLTFDVEGMPCEDVIFNLECVMAGAKWCAVDTVSYIYYRTGMTLLSKYKPSNFAGLHHASDVWKRYKDSVPGAREVFGGFGEVSEAGIVAAEKRNRLKPGSPYWLSKPYNFVRKLLYIRPVRRWNIKRFHPNAVDL